MSINPVHIFEGFSNLIKDYLKILPEEKQQIAKDRLAICGNCPIRSGNLCDPNQKIKHIKTGQMVKGCGCVIPMKVLAMATHCPAEKW